MENDQAAIALLLFRVGPVLCCAPADPVQTIIAPPKLTHPPGSNDAKPGIFYHADHVVSVSELRHRFGINEAEREQPGRMIITLHEDAFVAYWVDEILEVIDTPTEGWSDAPEKLPEGVFTKTLLLNDKIYLYARLNDFENLPEGNYLTHYIDHLNGTVPEEPTTENDLEAGQIDTGAAISLEPETNSDQDRETNAEDLPAVEHETQDSEDLAVSAGNDVEEIKVETETETETEISLEPISGTLVQSLPEEVSGQADDDIPADQTILATGSREETATETTGQHDVEPVSRPENTSAVNTDEDNTGINAAVKNNFPWKKLVASLAPISVIALTAAYYLLSPTANPPSSQPSLAMSEVTQTDSDRERVSSGESEVKNNKQKQTLSETKTPPPPENKESQKDNSYHAEIKPDDEGVTIVLHSPEKKPALRKNKTESTTKSSAGRSDKNRQTGKGEKEEIIHTVVQGDTLWAIANHYVSNPYKYPQLARLSKIKNPDRIYPGDRVRILRRPKSGRQ